MKNYYLKPAVLAIAALVSACGSAPKTTTLLDTTRSEYVMAQNNPNVATYAALEMKKAGEALAQANAAANDNDSSQKIDKLAFLANRQIAVAQEVAKQKSAEADVAKAGQERTQIRLDQRTNEADQAKQNEEQARVAALVSQSNAAKAQRDAQAANMEATEAQRQTAQAQARTAQLEAQLADLAAKKTERGMVITLGDVLFGTDLSRLNSDGMRTAQKLAQVLQQNPKRNVLIEGFADSTGAAAYNLALSNKRASAVRNALMEQGISDARIATRGYGEAHPVAANDTAGDRQLNRRVEIVLSDDSGKISQR